MLEPWGILGRIRAGGEPSSRAGAEPPCPAATARVPSDGPPAGRYAPGVSTTERSSEIAVEPAEVAEWREAEPDLQVVDVREDYEWEAGHLADSVHIELAELPARVGAIHGKRPVVFYCRVGSRSLMAARAFRASGFEAYSMDGGLMRWVQEGRPLQPADGYVAKH